MSQQPTVITITDYAEAERCTASSELRQALYDDGEVIMADVLVNLHGADHRDRRRLENRLFRREAYERTRSACSRRSSPRPSIPRSRRAVPNWWTSGTG